MSDGKQLGKMTSADVAAESRIHPQTLIVPLGATEQHGAHLPLDTDTTLAVAWADAVAARVPGAVVAPPLPYGSSGEHQTFPGTLSIGSEALRLLVIELVRSAKHTFARVVLLSGHGGNLQPLDRATTQLRAEGHDVIHLFPAWAEVFDGAGQAIPIDAHAGLTETSLMLHLQPADVRTELAVPGKSGPVSELMDEMMAGGIAAVSPSGVLGDPTMADADKGRRLLDALTDRTVKHLQNTAPGPVAD